MPNSRSKCLCIQGNREHAERYCERFNKEWAWLGIVAEVWAYLGSRPIAKADQLNSDIHPVERKR